MGAGITPTPEPTTGSILVTTKDVQDTPGEPVAIRLPGQEWSETLTLEDVSPGEYLIEVMDSEGNVSTATVKVTARDIIARSLRNGGAARGAVIAAVSAAAVALVLILLFAGYTRVVTVVNVPFTEEKKVRAMRRIMFRREETGRRSEAAPDPRR